MKFKYLKIVIIMIIFIIYALSVNVYAADNYTCNILLTPDTSSIKAGESITYELKVSDINAGDGIVMSEFYIDYNSDIFDCKVRSYDEDKWSINAYLEGKTTMSTYGVQPTKEDQIIAKIILTAKTGIADNTYQVKITNISFTAADDSKFAIADKSMDVKVQSTQSTSGGTSSGTSSSGGSTSSGTTSSGGSTSSGTTSSGGSTSSGTTSLSGSTSSGTTSSSGSTSSGTTSSSGSTSSGTTSSSGSTSSKTKSTSTKKKNTTKSNKGLPYAGDKETLIIMSGIIILAIISTIFYIRYKKINI